MNSGLILTMQEQNEALIELYLNIGPCVLR